MYLYFLPFYIADVTLVVFKFCLVEDRNHLTCFVENMTADGGAMKSTTTLFT